VSGPAAGLRIGDAERAAAADQLAWHFSQGRLDQAELDERLECAMRAATAGDLTRLFADLPDTEPVAAAGARPRPRPHPAASPRPARPRRRPRLASIVLALCIVVGAALVLRTLTHSIAALALIVLIAVLWLRRGRVRG
jgi:Domain of unknown function (DUF1707)